ncbi:MAG TPA: DUF4276 family protein [Pirellulales bacterium]|nr:DUF4276 family protein [Pirellulales bacterium]
MNELVVIVEGETEQTFVRDQLAGYLALHGTASWAVLPGRNRKRGGVKKWEVARQDIARTLKEGRYCTTMMDFYAMPDDWPGRVNARSLAWAERASHVEAKLLEDIVGVMGKKFSPQFFIPYVQLHEFEALAFADVGVLTSVVAPLSHSSSEQLEKQFSRILDEAGRPEAIDDGIETCPSRRITGIVKAYKKRIHGPIVTGRIGLETLRDRCDHFATWLRRLESIGS